MALNKEDMIASVLTAILKSKLLRAPLLKKLDQKMYKGIVEDDTEFTHEGQLEKYYFMRAMLNCSIKSLDKGYISPEVIKRNVSTLVKNAFMKEKRAELIIQKFKDEHNGTAPPSLGVLSPTQKCNLRCTGCYAASSDFTPNQLEYEHVEKIMDEAYNKWGVGFMVISGGEPFLYNDNGKTLLDLFEKYNEVFFLVYTNGTCITKDVAERLAKLGNVSPAISVEGFEKETDERRGPGIWKRILAAMDNLRSAGVPFGISVTGTRKNYDILMENKFYEYFFDEQGASYMWQFQLMPVGRAKDCIDLALTPEERVALYGKWKTLLKEDQYCVADFWNSGVLSNGCIAYGKGYLYVNWDGKIMPCVFVPYHVDNIKDLHAQGKTITDALFTDFFKNGRKWQCEYGLDNPKKAYNGLPACFAAISYNAKSNALLAV